MKIEGKSILEHIVDFLNHSKLIDEIIIAPTKLESDNKIESLAKKIGVSCFRGSSDDVLQRFYECASINKGELIIRITADNPLIDPEIVDQIINDSISKKTDYSSNSIKQTFPLGFTSCEVFSFKTLESLPNTRTDSQSREHITPYIRQNLHLFKTSNIIAPENLSRPKWRLTVDYSEDFTLIQKIFSSLYKKGNYISYQTLVGFLDKNSELISLNQENH